MMISLRAANKTDFEKYKPCFIADYSEELVQNYGLSAENSIKQATAELAESFPDGQALENNYLLCIERTEAGVIQVVGYLWYALDVKLKQGFICDFYILPPFRSLGFGKAALNALEEKLLNQNILQIKLRVAYTNDRALKLYETVGFKPTGTNLMKWLDQP